MRFCQHTPMVKKWQQPINRKSLLKMSANVIPVIPQKTPSNPIKSQKYHPADPQKKPHHPIKSPVGFRWSFRPWTTPRAHRRSWQDWWPPSWCCALENREKSMESDGNPWGFYEDFMRILWGFSWIFMDFPVSSSYFMGKFHVQTDTNWVCHWNKGLNGNCIRKT